MPLRMCSWSDGTENPHVHLHLTVTETTERVQLQATVHMSPLKTAHGRNFTAPGYVSHVR